MTYAITVITTNDFTATSTMKYAITVITTNDFTATHNNDICNNSHNN